MGSINQKDSKEDKISNSSVLSLSLYSINSILDLSSSNSDDNNNNLKKKDNFSNEIIESKEIMLEGKEEEIKLKFFTEDEMDFNILKKNIKRRKRSKTYNKINNAPKQNLKITNEIISPLKLNSKNFGIYPILGRKVNLVMMKKIVMMNFF